MLMLTILTQQRYRPEHSGTEIHTTMLAMDGTRQECFAQAAARCAAAWNGDNSGVVTFFYCEPADPAPPAVSAPVALYRNFGTGVLDVHTAPPQHGDRHGG
jgi:hypothetical protein